MGGGGPSKLANNPMDDRLQKKINTEKRKKEEEKKERKRLQKEQTRIKKEAKRNRNKGLKNVKPPITPVLVVSSSRSNVTDNEPNDIMKLLKKQLTNDSETFIINQMLLSVEFFRNYQRDIQETSRLARREQDEQTRKISQYHKRVLIQDRILQTVEKFNRYRYRHGPMKGELLLIQRPTKYIVFDNIEIIKQSEVEDEIYSKIEDTSGRPSLKIVIDNDEKFNMVDNKEHPGFYRLRNSEIISSNKYYGQHSKYEDDYDDADDDDDDEEISHDTKTKPNRKIRDSIAVPKTKAKRIQQLALKNYNHSIRPSSSTPSPSSSEYDYTYINHINSHRPLNEMRTTFASDEPFSALTIPQSCFIKVKMKQEEDDEDDDDEDHYNKKTMHIKLSLHSKSFFYYFTNAFKCVLATELGFEEEEIDNATWKGASIFIEPFEIIPAIQCKWPEKIAYDFSKRSRTSIENHATGKTHQWPPQELIKIIINRTPCHIIPNGYAPKEGTNPERDFEWQIVFPVAEQLLESNLSNAQLKIYVLFKLLIKTFIEPLIGDRYNLTNHIRHHLFWQFERQYPLMSEEFLGERLIHILNSLLERIGKTTLYDFFLPSRNLLYNIPSNVLIALHEGLYRISEFPARYLIIALRNLQVIGKPIYPRFNYKRLYDALTLDAITLLNPNLSTQKFNREPPPQDTFNDIIAVGAIGLCEQQEKQDKSVKRTVRFNENRTKKRKDSTESIREFRVEKQMDEQRRQVIFELFIPHFIEMAKASANFETFEKSLLFLKQAENLCKIIAEDNYNIQPYITEIKEIWHKVIAAKMEKSREMPQKGSSLAPPLPRRESLLDPKQQRRNTLAKKSVTIQEVDDDPYTNIDLIRSSIGIQPAGFSDSDEDEPSPAIKTNGLVKKEPRKSILTNGNRPNGIVIERVQIHTPRPPIIDDENNNKAHSNNVQWSTNNSTTTKNSVNTANRRKSSTKFVQMSNGYDDSDDSNDNENEDTKRKNKAQEFTKATSTTTKSSANIANRRKSSTKFIQTPNGFSDQSDDSNEIQVHTPKQPSNEIKNKDLKSINKVQELPNSTTTSVNTTRRKSSTKFIPNGHISEDSDEEEPEDTSF